MGTVNETNPLLAIEHPIPFDRIEAGHVEPAVDALLEQARQDLKALEDSAEPPTYDNTLGALDRLTERLGRAMGVVGHLESVATSPALREAYNAVQPRVSAFYSAIPMSRALYGRLQALAHTDDARKLDATRSRHLHKTIEEFEREGAALGDADKKRLEQLNVQLSELTTRFAQNVLDSTNAFELVVEDRERLAGLPERAVDAARHSAEQKELQGYRFTLQAPSMLPVMTYLDDAALREKVYRAYYGRAVGGDHDNRELLTRILELRAEKARLLGFRNFVDLVLADRMAGEGERARHFLEDLRDRSLPAFERENRELREFCSRTEGEGAPPLEPWDVGYYAEKQRVALYDFDEEALRPYFAL
ncbi:MAG: M3 family metallopeptidase, partial [Myxococcales bacterium]